MILHEGSRVNVRYGGQEQFHVALSVFANWWSWEGSTLTPWEVFVIAHETAIRWWSTHVPPPPQDWRKP